MTTANGAEQDKVRAHTAPEILREIDAQIEERIRFYAAQPPDVVSRRIKELEREWDVERCLETNASALALSGVVLGAIAGRKWLFLTVGALGVLLRHALGGWSPPLAALRRLGIRTRTEIDREKYALKILRGDFKAVAAADPDQLRRNPASEVLCAVSS